MLAVTQIVPRPPGRFIHTFSYEILLAVGTDAGASVFRQPSPNNWVFEAHLQCNPAALTPFFANSPALGSDGSFLVVGFANTNDEGSICAFVRGTSWTFLSLLTLPDPAFQDELGNPIVLAGPGLSLVVAGAPLQDLPIGTIPSVPRGMGNVYIFPIQTLLSQVVVTGTVSVTGDVTLAPSSTLIFSPGASLSIINGSLVIQPGAVVVIDAIVSGSVTFLNAPTITGQFSSVAATTCNRTADASVVSVTYTALSISALIQVSPNCGALSTAAIVGIAIGSILGGAAVAIAIGLLTCWGLKRYDKRANRSIKAAELNSVTMGKQS